MKETHRSACIDSVYFSESFCGFHDGDSLDRDFIAESFSLTVYEGDRDE